MSLLAPVARSTRALIDDEEIKMISTKLDDGKQFSPEDFSKQQDRLKNQLTDYGFTTMADEKAVFKVIFMHEALETIELLDGMMNYDERTEAMAQNALDIIQKRMDLQEEPQKPEWLRSFEMTQLRMRAILSLADFLISEARKHMKYPNRLALFGIMKFSLNFSYKTTIEALKASEDPIKQRKAIVEFSERLDSATTLLQAYYVMMATLHHLKG